MARPEGRNRPWRLASHRMHFSDVHEDPDTAVAARSLDRLLRSRYFSRLESFYANRSGYPLAWQESTGGSRALLHLTPEELRSVDEQIAGHPGALSRPERRRLAPPRRRASR